MDGQEYPNALRGSQAINTISYRRGVDAYTVEYTQKADGKVTYTATRTVSKDGKTMTERGKGTNPQGQPVNNVIVFEKQ